MVYARPKPACRGARAITQLSLAVGEVPTTIRQKGKDTVSQEEHAYTFTRDIYEKCSSTLLLATF